MALTHAPLPSAWSIIRALASKTPEVDSVTEKWSEPGELVTVYSRSAWSLAVLVHMHRLSGTDKPTLLIPDYFCNSSLAEARDAGARVEFYRVTEDAEPDLSWCRKNIPDGRGLALFVHYFGQPRNIKGFSKLMSKRGYWVVEDAAHVLTRPSGVGAVSDAVIFSPHKLLAIPSGAILILRPRGPSLQGMPGSAIEKTLQAAHSKIPKGIDGVSSWLLKRAIQKGVPEVFWSLFSGRIQPFEVDPLTSQGTPPSCNSLSLKLLEIESQNLGWVEHARISNALLLSALDPMNAIQEIGEIAPLFAEARHPDLASAEAHYQFLASHRLPVISWPDLPPEVRKAEENHPIATRLRSTRVMVQVHQTLDEHAAFRALRKRGTRVRPLSLELIRDVGQWESHLAAAGQSAITQSWGYGEAKRIQGWKPRRFILEQNGDAVGLAQMFTRGVGFKVTRLNRGPMWLPGHSKDVHEAGLAAIRGLGRLWRGSTLFVAPELTRSASSILTMTKLGFRRLRRAPWISIWIDLHQEEDALRAQLKSRWRTPLAKAEKADDFRVSLTNGDRGSEWLIDRHDEARRTHGYNAPSGNFIHSLRSCCERGSFQVALVKQGEDDPLAGVGIVRHGATATYLLGWTGAEGRATGAGHLALWSAITECRHRGVRWFDLGGIDHLNTPGITRYKEGLGGSRYVLVGEYYAI